MQINLEQAIKLHQSGQLDAAQQAYTLLLSSHDDNHVHYLLGLLYSQREKFHLAIKHLELSIATNKNNANMFNALALCYQKTEKFRSAEHLINRAINLAPETPAFCNRKSKILHAAGKISDSMFNAKRCINLHPDFFPGYQTYASISLETLRPDNSLRIMKRAFKQMPDNPDVFFSLAEAFYNAGKPEKAIPLFKALIRNNFRLLECFNNLANIEREYGEVELAEKYYQQARENAVDETMPIVNWNISLLDLLKENFTSGWINYEDRLKLNSPLSKAGHLNIWRGESLANKSILIISEQGLGDQILFSSSFNKIIKSSKKAYIQCDERLKECFKRSFPSAEIISDIDPHVIKAIDVKIFAGSIIQYLQHPTNEHKFLKSNIPQLPTDNGYKFKIGFSWRGGTTYKDIKKRSTHLREWQSLFSKDKCQFYCLQHNLTETEKNLLKSLSSEIVILPEISDKNDVNELINVCGSMDLIISVTNTVTHIAGALGKTTWCLTPHNPDWPWGLRNESCLWYSSVKLFRKEEKNWKHIFSRIENNLESLLKTKKR